MTGIQELHQRRGGIDTNCAMPDCRGVATGAYQIRYRQGRSYSPPIDPIEPQDAATFQTCPEH